MWSDSLFSGPRYVPAGMENPVVQHRRRMYLSASLGCVFLAFQFQTGGAAQDPLFAVLDPALANDPAVATLASANTNPAPGLTPNVLAATATASFSPSELRRIAQSDPMQLARIGRDWYAHSVRDYSCVFFKQEFIDNELTPVQKIRVLYREAPHSVYMTWLENPDGAKRALYVKGRNVDDDGQERAQVEPAGPVIRLFVSETLVPIRGSLSKKASRRTIDEFGFKSTFDMLFTFNAIAEHRGTLKLSYAGEGSIDGRPTFIIIRNLPYDGPNGAYPDARMVLHLDQEWLLPVAVYSYADAEGKKLLGSYVSTEVRLNPGLGDAAFQF